MQDYRQASLSEQDRAMLDYAHKLTRTPWEVQEEDVERLRQVGFGDRQIANINGVTAYYNFINRVAQGLGVEIEDSNWSDERGA